MTDTTPKEETPRCERCARPGCGLVMLHWETGKLSGTTCPRSDDAHSLCADLAALRSEVEALWKRNEELEQLVSALRSANCELYEKARLAVMGPRKKR